MTILIFLVISYILLSVSLFFLFPKANVDNWKGLIPILNFIEWCKIIGRPKWWAALLLIPIVNIFIFAGMCVDLVRSFGRHTLLDATIAVIYPPAIFGFLAKKKSEKYVEPIMIVEAEHFNKLNQVKNSNQITKYNRLNKDKRFYKSNGREWFESIIFAVFAAAFIRMFLIEAYVIPTPSMEGSLLVGDFLFVSKAHYGIRTPQTVAMIPLLHNRIPILNKESYLSVPKLPYYRTPAFESIDNNDPIVFNWPVGDSVYVTSKRSYTVNQVSREKGFAMRDRELRKLIKNKEYIVRPIDKKDHYIKRCIAKAGDTLHIRNKQVYINSKKVENPKEMQFLYAVQWSNSNISKKRLEKLGIENEDINGSYGYFLTNDQLESFKELDPNVRIIPHPFKVDPVSNFPHDPKHFPNWSIDNYGPIWIPKKGETVNLSKDNIALYKRIIGVYEHNKLELKNGDIFINDTRASSYTFKQDYYWAMGDNRHNSEDSRSWGFVPHDHIVGKPLFIWFSTKSGSIGNGIRWDRLFSSANKF